MASIITQNSKVQMSTARLGVMRALKPDNTRAGEVLEHVPNIKESDLVARIISAELGQLTSELCITALGLTDIV